MKKIVLACLLAKSLFALEIVGLGYGTENEAKKSALDDLSHNIAVNVSSDYTSFVSKDDKNYDKKVNKLITIKSELPILGAKFAYEAPSQTMSVTLSEQNALSLYTTKLNDLKTEIEKLNKKIESTKSNDEKYSLYELLLATLQSYDKHEIVALMLGYKKTESLAISSLDVEAKMITLAKDIDSIELASKLLAKKFDKKNIYVFPLTTNGSNEITPFASVLKDTLSSKLNIATSPNASDYYLSGNYEVSNDGIFLTYNLLDKNNNTLKSSSVFLSKSAYKNLRATPNNLTFDQEVELSKDKLKSELKVELTLKEFGNKQVLLKENQEVQLIAKSNREAYIYIVGHTLHEKEKFSYLIELQEANGDERFLYTLPASEVNRPVPLSEFVISEPFGYESLQMFASTSKPELPTCKPKGDFCVIGEQPQIVVAKTRALKAKKQGEMKAEASLSFTTIKK
jgi:hypothetical protein